jgi:hypothetical protein
MKKFNILSLATIAFLSSLAVSCDDEVPTVIEENEVPNGTLTMVYSVQVKASSTLSARTQGLDGVTVTINQNGERVTATTDASGIVSFANMRLGRVSIFVQGLPGFLSVNTTDFIGCATNEDGGCDYLDLDNEQTEYAQTEIILPRLGATVTGQLLADQDFTGAAGPTAVPTTAVVIATISNEFEPNTFKVNVGANGVFTFTNLPEKVAATLTVDLKLPDNVTNTAQPVDRTFGFGAPGGSRNIGGNELSVNNPLNIGDVILSSTPE